MLFSCNELHQMDKREYEKAVQEYRQSLNRAMEYMEKIDASRQALKNASEALQENPDCGQLRCEVLHLQEEILRLSCDSDREDIRFYDLSYKLEKAEKLYFESGTKHHVNTVSPETQCPGTSMRKQQMRHCCVLADIPLRECFSGFQSGYGMSGVYRYITSCLIPNVQNSYNKQD